MSGGERYQRLPGQEAASAAPGEEDHEGSHDEDSGDETSNNSPLQETQSIFRSSPWSKTDPAENESTAGSTTSTTTAGPSSPMEKHKKLNNNDNDDCIINNNNGPHSPMQVMLSRSHSTRSAGSFDFEDDYNNDAWQDDDVAVRRYHLDFNHGDCNDNGSNNNNGNNMRASSNNNNSNNRHSSLWKLTWQGFLELQTAARQRRAARLLTMPSESFHYKLHACLMTWCCDATDRGIFLVAAVTVIWILIGWIAGLDSSWWYAGSGLFCLRVTCRRLFENVSARRLRRRRRMISTGSSTEIRAVRLDSVATTSSGDAGGGGGSSSGGMQQQLQQHEEESEQPAQLQVV